MKFRIIVEERLDGSIYYSAQGRKCGWFHLWHNLDCFGHFEKWSNHVETIDEAKSAIEKARVKYKHTTVKCRTAIPA